MVFSHILSLMGFGMLIWLSSFMKCLCMAPLTPVVMIMRGFIFQMLFREVLLVSQTQCVCVQGLVLGIYCDNM